MVIGEGNTVDHLSDARVREIVTEATASLSLEGKKVLVIIPDSTRTMPMPMFFRLLQELLAPRAAALDYLVALGTHMPMNDEQLGKLVGQDVRERPGRKTPGSSTTSGPSPPCSGPSAPFRPRRSASSPTAGCRSTSPWC